MAEQGALKKVDGPMQPDAGSQNTNTDEARLTARESTALEASVDYDSVGHSVRTTFVIVAQARCGSTVLCMALRDAGIGVPIEYLNAALIRVLYARVVGSSQRFDLATYVEALKRYRTTSNGFFGMKCLYSQLERRLQSPSSVQDFILQFDRIIVLNRKDKLAQAISALKAERTGVWNSRLRSTGDPRVTFDPAFITARINRFVQQDRFIAEMQLANKRPTLELHYEAVRDSFETVWRQLTSFLGFEPHQVDVPMLQQHVLRDAASEELERRYLDWLQGRAS